MSNQEIKIGDFVIIRNSMHVWFGKIICLKPLKAMINQNLNMLLRGGFKVIPKEQVPINYLKYFTKKGEEHD